MTQEVKKSPVEELYKALKGVDGVPPPFMDMERLKAEGKSLKKTYVLQRRDIIPRAGKTKVEFKSTVDTLTLELQGCAAWGCLEIDKVTKMPVVYVWKPETAPLSTVLSGKKLCKSFAETIKQLAESFVPAAESKDFKVHMMHWNESMDGKPPLVRALVPDTDPKEYMDTWTMGGAWSPGDMTKADGIECLRVHFRRVVRLMVEAAAMESKAPEMFIMVRVQQSTSKLAYSLSFRYQGEAPDFNAPFSTSEQADLDEEERRLRVASSPHVRPSRTST